MTFLSMNKSPRIIEDQIIGYIKSLRNDDVSYSTIKFLISPIFTYYQLNHVVLSRKTVSRYMGEFKRRVKDEAYTNENILQMLQNTDRRMRMCTLIMASTGCRIGALPDLTLGSLTKIPDYGLYKIVFYEGSSSEYYNFTTREAALSVDNYRPLMEN